MTQTRQERDQEIHDMVGRLSGYIGETEACDIVASALVLQSKRRDLDLDLGHALSIVIYRAKRDLEARGLSIGSWATQASRDGMASWTVRAKSAGAAGKPVSLDLVADTIVDTRYDDVDRAGAMHALADRIAGLPRRGQSAVVRWLNNSSRADKASSDGRMVYRYLDILGLGLRARDIWLGYRELSARTGLVIR